jgi:hypothetical protein
MMFSADLLSNGDMSWFMDASRSPPTASPSFAPAKWFAVCIWE